MTAYYNEFDPFAADWLENLIYVGAIAPGFVDRRSIEDVTPGDLAGFTQCHFFAGIGVWSHALRAAGWSDDRPVWTGSCPCQPFSAAGKGNGFDDPRHLWPAFHWLIASCRPDAVFGEQVSSKDGLAWLDTVSADLENSDYAFGALDICAAGVGAPHIRQRSYWVGIKGLDDTASARHDGSFGGPEGNPRDETRLRVPSARSGVCGLADAHDYGFQRGLRGRPGTERQDFDGPAGRGGPINGLAHALPTGRAERRTLARDGQATGLCASSWVADSGSQGRRENTGSPLSDENAHGRTGRHGGKPNGDNELGGHGKNDWPRPYNVEWANSDWLFCRDGKWRPVEPRTFPLANGASNRVGALRGYGNALVAPVAQTFVESVMEIID